MKGKGPAASGIRVKAVGETRFNAGALIEKRKRSEIRGQHPGQSLTILRGLYFNACECDAFFLGLHHPGRFAINVEKIICKAMAVRERKVSEGDSPTCLQICTFVVLNVPPGYFQGLVDLLAGFVFRRWHAQAPLANQKRTQ